MLIRSGLVLLILNCVRTTEFVGANAVNGGRLANFNRRFSFWPSVHNAARLLRVRREAEKAAAVIQSEGGAVLQSAIETPSDLAKALPSSGSNNSSRVLNVEPTTPNPSAGEVILVLLLHNIGPSISCSYSYQHEMLSTFSL